MKKRKDATTNQPYYIVISGQLIFVSEAVYRTIRQDEWRIAKQEERTRKCRDEHGNRCKKKCADCPFFQSGAHLSLERMIEDGHEPADSHDILSILMKRELIAALQSELSLLDESSRKILLLFGEGMSERQIAEQTGIPRKTINYRKNKLLQHLRDKLSSYL